MTASGIRNGLAFGVVIACAYYHLVEKRNIILCLFGYAGGVSAPFLADFAGGVGVADLIDHEV